MATKLVLENFVLRLVMDRWRWRRSVFESRPGPETSAILSDMRFRNSDKFSGSGALFDRVEDEGNSPFCLPRHSHALTAYSSRVAEPKCGGICTKEVCRLSSLLC
jgi:hypothetical protein